LKTKTRESPNDPHRNQDFFNGIQKFCADGSRPDVSAFIVRSASAQSQRTGAIAPCLWVPEESQVESCEHQDNANIHCQPFPESVSEEHEIYTDYDGYHRHHVKHDSYLSAHFGSLLKWRA
jgi:hypothetical protein